MQNHYPERGMSVPQVVKDIVLCGKASNDSKEGHSAPLLVEARGIPSDDEMNEQL